MDANLITNLISTVGFPIVAFFVIVMERRKDSEKIDRLSTALNNNTLVMNKVLERFDEK